MELNYRSSQYFRSPPFFAGHNDCLIIRSHKDQSRDSTGNVRSQVSDWELFAEHKKVPRPERAHSRGESKLMQVFSMETFHFFRGLQSPTCHEEIMETKLDVSVGDERVMSTHHILISMMSSHHSPFYFKHDDNKTRLFGMFYSFHQPHCSLHRSHRKCPKARKDKLGVSVRNQELIKLLPQGCILWTRFLARLMFRSWIMRMILRFNGKVRVAAQCLA